MSPKFRGNSDDWLDDEGKGSARRAPSRAKKGSAKVEYLPAGEANAVVAEVFPKLVKARLDAESAAASENPAWPRELLCSFRRSGVVGISEDEARERTPMAVGDRIKVRRTSPDSGVVEGVCERRNRLSRPAPGRDERKLQHVLAANVDLLVVVASTHEPEFTPGLVDRFLVAAQAAGIPAMICITKMDLMAQGAPRPWALYRELGFEVAEVCSKQGLGIDSLRERLLNRTVVFCGKSGAGKTSLLRALLRSDVGRVAEVSEATGKGRHTTTGAVLLEAPGGSRWIDTPGVREFGLAQVAPEALASYFPELRALPCAAGGCLHDGEVGCEAGDLPRYSSYRRILESIRSGEG